jgi:TolA-binding protein
MEGGTLADRGDGGRSEDGGGKRRRPDESAQSNIVAELLDRAIDGPRGAEARGSQGNGVLCSVKKEAQDDENVRSNPPADNDVRPGKRMKAEQVAEDPGGQGKGNPEYASVASMESDQANSLIEGANARGSNSSKQRKQHDDPAAVMGHDSGSSMYSSSAPGKAGDEDEKSTQRQWATVSTNGAKAAAGAVEIVPSSTTAVKVENADTGSYGSALMSSSSSAPPVVAKSAVEALLGTGSIQANGSRGTAPFSHNNAARYGAAAAAQDCNDNAGSHDTIKNVGKGSGTRVSQAALQSGTPGTHEKLRTDWLSIVPAVPSASHLAHALRDSKQPWKPKKALQARCDHAWLKQVHGIDTPLAETSLPEGTYNRRGSAFWKVADAKQDAALREITVLLRHVISQDTARMFSSGEQHQQHGAEHDSRPAKVDLTWVLRGIRQGIYRRALHSTQPPAELCANDVESVWMECARKHARGSPELMRALELRIVFATGLHKILDSLSLPAWRGISSPMSLKYQVEGTTLCLHGVGGVVQAAYTQLWQAGHRGTLHHGGFATVYCPDVNTAAKAQGMVQMIAGEAESEAQEALQLLQSASAAMFLPTLSAMNLVPTTTTQQQFQPQQFQQTQPHFQQQAQAQTYAQLALQQPAHASLGPMSQSLAAITSADYQPLGTITLPGALPRNVGAIMHSLPTPSIMHPLPAVQTSLSMLNMFSSAAAAAVAVAAAGAQAKAFPFAQTGAASLQHVQQLQQQQQQLQQLLLQQHAHQLQQHQLQQLQQQQLQQQQQQLQQQQQQQQQLQQQQAAALLQAASGSSTPQSITPSLSISIPQTPQLPPIQVSSHAPPASSMLPGQNSPLPASALPALTSPSPVPSPSVHTLKQHQHHAQQSSSWNVANSSSPVPASMAHSAKLDAVSSQAKDSLAPAHSITLPHRCVDMFCIRTVQGTAVDCDACVGERAQPLHLVGALAHQYAEIVEGETYAGGQTGTVVSVKVVDWFCEMNASDKSAEPVLWVLGERAWYRLLRPSLQYASVYAGFLERMRCCDALCNTLSKQPNASFHSVVQQVRLCIHMSYWRHMYICTNTHISVHTHTFTYPYTTDRQTDTYPHKRTCLYTRKHTHLHILQLACQFNIDEEALIHVTHMLYPHAQIYTHTSCLCLLKHT